MGVDPPFLYDPPSKHGFSGPTERGYNPRAATQASWTPPLPRPKRDGPLVDFNRHPDSYLIVPYGNLNVKPMSPRTKKKVTRVRQLQLFLRVCALLGALGLLVCVIAIKNTSGSVGWIIRVAPGVAILQSLYAIYHLCRSSTSRTPASSASYMLFAIMIDAGLIPFLVFTAIISRTEYTTGSYGWETLFATGTATHDVVHATFLLSITNGGIAVASLFIGLYLAILFRKIAKLPPDMNPLEDNLTARPHKRNKSELTISDKHMSQTTLASSNGNRLSGAADPLIAPVRNVPFMHTRTDSAENLAAYRFSQPNSQRGSRVDLSNPNQSQRQMDTQSIMSYRSRADVPNLLGAPQQRSTREGRAPNQNTNRSLVPPPLTSSPPSRPSSARTSYIGTPDRSLVPAPLVSTPPSRPTTAVNSSPNTCGVRPGITSQPTRSSITSQPTRSSLLKENWVSYPSPSPSPSPTDENKPPISPPSSRGGTPGSPVSAYVSIQDSYAPSLKDWYTPQSSPRKSEYEPLEQRETRRTSLYDFERDVTSPPPRPDSKPMHPLGMNPPTPQLNATPVREPRRIALTDGDVNIPDRANNTSRPSLNSRPASFVGSGGKTRFYGDLQRGLSAIGQSTTIGKAKGKTGYSDTASNYSLSEYETVRADDDDEDYVDKDLDQRGRVISNTNVDVGTYAGLGAGFGQGMGRRRDVSGKVAEEGRAISPESKQRAAQAQGLTAGAAGWARWKGL